MRRLAALARVTDEAWVELEAAAVPPLIYKGSPQGARVGRSAGKQGVEHQPGRGAAVRMAVPLGRACRRAGGRHSVPVVTRSRLILKQKWCPLAAHAGPRPKPRRGATTPHGRCPHADRAPEDRKSFPDPLCMVSSTGTG